jgi:hypothetical protein
MTPAQTDDTQQTDDRTLGEDGGARRGRPPKKQIRHLEGCPAMREEEVEGTKPARPDLGEPAQRTLIRRCIDCGQYVPLRGDVRPDG